jgi:hypothetical protein
MHAKWQGSIEEPAAKDFLARKVRTIKLNKVQGTNWNVIKCEECLGSHPEAGNNQPFSTTLEIPWGFLAQAYCVDLAEAYVTQENVSLRILHEKKRYDLQLPNGHSHEKPSAKGGTGKEFLYQVPKSVLL